VTDEQQAPVGRDLRGRIARLRCVEFAGQRGVDPQALALMRAPLGGGDLGRLAGPRLGARQDRVEPHPEASERDPRGLGLALAARGQRAVGVGTRTVGLGLGMT